jgi:hypothetical protein
MRRIDTDINTVILGRCWHFDHDTVVPPNAKRHTVEARRVRQLSKGLGVCLKALHDGKPYSQCCRIILDCSKARPAYPGS